MIATLSRWPQAALRLTLVVLLTMLVTLPVFGYGAAQDAEPVEVKVRDEAFEPDELTVPAGATVTWTNAGGRLHTVTADDGTFDSGRLDPGEQFSYTFEQPGTYPYSSTFPPEMQASITVTETDTVDEVTPTPVEQPAQQADRGSATATGPARNLSPVESTRLAHIHAGTCEELGIVVYSFPDIRTYRIDEGDEAGVGAIELIMGTAKVELTDLFGEPFSIHVHESEQNKQTYIACADVGGEPDGSWSEADGLTLHTEEQNGSGYSGFATLKPAAAGETAVTIAIAASGAATEAAAAQAPPPPSETYTSPSFGYTIGYGPVWEETENISGGSRDRFVLFNGTSYVTFTGQTGFGGDPQACVDAFLEQLTADPNVSNLSPAVDEDGNPLRGSTEATGVFAINNHDYTFADGVVPYTLYVHCIPLIPNEAVLAIVQNVPTEDYEEQAELRDALMRGLTLAQ